MTPTIYFHLNKYYITNVYHRYNSASMQEFLDIHCLRCIKTAICFQHWHYHPANVVYSNYTGVFLINKPQKPLLCIWRVSFTNITHQSPIIQKILLTVLQWASPTPFPPRFRLSSAHATCCTSKRKPLDVSRRSHPVQFSQ